MSEPVVFLSNVHIHQGNEAILNDVHLSLMPQSFTYLIGKTGSGKTSLLKTLYGILPLEKGQGRVAGFDLKSLDRHTLPLLRRKVGYIFQDFILLSDRSVGDNLRFALRATGWRDKHRIQLQIEAVLILVGMLDAIHKMPYQLSGGEQQRIVIARALLNEPQLIIADEPTGNLDPETAEEILILLKNLVQNQHTSILFATHNYPLLQRFPAPVLECLAGKLIY